MKKDKRSQLYLEGAIAFSEYLCSTCSERLDANITNGICHWLAMSGDGPIPIYLSDIMEMYPELQLFDNRDGGQQYFCSRNAEGAEIRSMILLFCYEMTK